MPATACLTAFWLATRPRLGPRIALPSLVAALLLLVAVPAAAGRTFYIDFDSGSDRADGRSPESAWKRAPGDSRAGPMPRGTNLAPGDRLLFRGGVAYRGTIVARTAGTEAAPIAYIGNAWGTTPAILDGGEPAGRLARRPDGRRAATLPAGVHPADGLFLDGRPLQPADFTSAPTGGRHHVTLRAAPGARLAHAAGRVGFLMVAGGHVEIRGFTFRHFAPAPRHGPYAGHPLVALQPLPGVTLAALEAAGGSPQPLLAPPPVVAMAGWASTPGR